MKENAVKNLRNYPSTLCFLFKAW